jgi:hypothetical protein
MLLSEFYEEVNLFIFPVAKQSLPKAISDFGTA